MDLNAFKIDWRTINSARALRAVLVSAIAELRESGLSVLAKRWESRLPHMPRKMGKEAINYVLISAHKEAKGANDGQSTTSTTSIGDSTAG